MEFSIVEEAVGSRFLVKLLYHQINCACADYPGNSSLVQTQYSYWAPEPGQRKYFWLCGSKNQERFSSRFENGWGPEAKRMMGVQGEVPPEASKFWPHLGTKISILKPHFYFLDFFIYYFALFFCHPLFFLGAALPGISKPWPELQAVDQPVSCDYQNCKSKDSAYWPLIMLHYGICENGLLNFFHHSIYKILFTKIV